MPCFFAILLLVALVLPACGQNSTLPPTLTRPATPDLHAAHATRLALLAPTQTAVAATLSAAASPPTRQRPTSTPTPQPPRFVGQGSQTLSFYIGGQPSYLFVSDYLGPAPFTALIANATGQSQVIANCPQTCRAESLVTFKGGDYSLQIKSAGTWAIEAIEPPPAAASSRLPPTPIPPLVQAKKNVNLRAGPGTNYDIVGALSPGQSFPITGRTADSAWWQIIVNDSPAWVAASVVTALNTTQDIQIVVAPPPPTPALPPSPLPPSTPALIPTFTPAPYSPAPPPPGNSGCCKICAVSKACGDSCISPGKTCHKPPGCACNG